MGFVSKLEDEKERRGGDEARPIFRRVDAILNELAENTKPPINPARMNFDSAAQEELRSLLAQAEESRRRIGEAVARRNVKMSFRWIAKHKKRVHEIVAFLVPYVCAMRGERRRYWNRRIEQMKKIDLL